MLKSRLLRALIPSLLVSSLPVAAQPTLKAPYGCAQVWDGWTYQGHNDLDSLDFALWKDRTQKSDPQNQNISYGQFVMASGAGVVTKDDLIPDDEWGLVRRINIKHDDSWSTVYLHTIIEPEPLAVGRKVAAGEVIAMAGRSGTDPDGWHIHYSQKQGEEIVPARFDGVTIQTPFQAQQIVSSNCTARSFARWRDGGETYIFRYHPENGQARITRMADGNGAAVHTWTSQEGAWGKSFTDFLPYKVNGIPHLLRYNARNGRATFYRVETNGSGLQRLADTFHWRPGWTLLRQVRHENLNFVIAYDSRTGYRQFLQLAPDDSSAAVDDSVHDIKGWTHILGFDRGDNQYLLFYKASTGRTLIRRMDRVVLLNKQGRPTNRIRIELVDVFDGFRNPNWTHLQLARQDGELYMVGYRASNGRAAIWHLGNPADGPQNTARFTLGGHWDIVTSLPMDQGPQIFFYGVDAGNAKLFSVQAGGSGLSAQATMNWVGGWR